MTRATPKALLWADRQLGRLAGLLAVAGGLAIVALMVITLAAVISRYIFRDPIFGTEDLSQMVLVLVAGAAVAYGARHQSHVSVNLLGTLGGRRLTRITDLIMRALTLFILVLAVYALTKKACGSERACITANFSIEHRPFYYYLAVAMALYAVTTALHLVIGLFHFTGDDPNEMAD
ncbi:TRAP transporter small permease [Alterinioella nitratireducens]|uniref:TRAP transporter small permease n=1 Tax=Alterinioella nitratireducens TaxID=2735915 RepID=UPI004057EEFB